MERKLISEADSRPLIVIDPRSPASPDALDAAVRAAGSLVVHFARRTGCSLLLPGDRHAAIIEHDLLAWPALHVRLALLDDPPAHRWPRPRTAAGSSSTSPPDRSIAPRAGSAARRKAASWSSRACSGTAARCSKSRVVTATSPAVKAARPRSPRSRARPDGASRRRRRSDRSLRAGPRLPPDHPRRHGRARAAGGAGARAGVRRALGMGRAALDVIARAGRARARLGRRGRRGLAIAAMVAAGRLEGRRRTLAAAGAICRWRG